MVSFDIVNLYTNVQVEETIGYLENYLIDNSKLKKEELSDLIKLLKICVRQNYFSFKDSIYLQNDGSGMGSPLSGTLAEMFFNHNESDCIMDTKNILKRNIIFYHRYVDDILCLFYGSARQITNFNKHLNNIPCSLRFTNEIESKHNINYLGLNLSKV